MPDPDPPTDQLSAWQAAGDAVRARGMRYVSEVYFKESM